MVWRQAVELCPETVTAGTMPANQLSQSVGGERTGSNGVALVYFSAFYLQRKGKPQRVRYREKDPMLRSSFTVQDHDRTLAVLGRQVLCAEIRHTPRSTLLASACWRARLLMRMG